jgi:hypothetical protein
MVRELGRGLEAAGFNLRDGWVVSATAWRNYFCRDARCCPLPGRPVAEITDSRLSAELVFGGSGFSSSAETAVEPAPVPDSRLAAERRMVESLTARYRNSCRDTWTTVPQFRAGLGVWETAIAAAGRHPPDPGTAAFLLASLGSKAIRDSVLVLAARGRKAAEQGAAASHLLSCRNPDSGPVVPEPFPRPAAGGGPPPAAALVQRSARARRRYSSVLSGQSTQSPRWENVDALYSLLIRLAAVASGESEAAVHSMLAWIEFARGRGSRACVYLARAERACPGYRLAGLLRELIDRGGLPEWARHPDTAWTAGSRSLL